MLFMYEPARICAGGGRGPSGAKLRAGLPSVTHRAADVVVAAIGGGVSTASPFRALRVASSFAEIDEQAVARTATVNVRTARRRRFRFMCTPGSAGAAPTRSRPRL